MQLRIQHKYIASGLLGSLGGGEACCWCVLVCCAVAELLSGFTFVCMQMLHGLQKSEKFITMRSVLWEPLCRAIQVR